MDVRPGATRNNIDQLNGADINNVTFTNMKFPIGRYMKLDEDEVYAVEYLAFIQDEDVDKSAGSSTFDNIKIYEDDSSLSISVDGASVELGTYQNGYKSQDSADRSPSKQDQDGHLMSFDGNSVTLVGNHWKALSMPEHLLTASSVLEFDVSVEEEAEVSLFIARTREADWESGLRTKRLTSRPRSSILSAWTTTSSTGSPTSTASPSPGASRVRTAESTSAQNTT